MRLSLFGVDSLVGIHRDESRFASSALMGPNRTAKQPVGWMGKVGSKRWEMRACHHRPCPCMIRSDVALVQQPDRGDNISTMAELSIRVARGGCSGRADTPRLFDRERLADRVRRWNRRSRPLEWAEAGKARRARIARGLRGAPGRWTEPDLFFLSPLPWTVASLHGCFAREPAILIICLA